MSYAWHYHVVPQCLTNVGSLGTASHIIGIALDGCPVYGGYDNQALQHELLHRNRERPADGEDGDVGSWQYFFFIYKKQEFLQKNACFFPIRLAH